jgi:two-component system, chemotaxis family, sensor kinase CheA
MSALLDQFVEEAGDLLEAAGAALLVLERNPADQGAVNDLFRSVHTLKGTSALFDLPALTKLVHAGEDLLDGVREGSIAVSADFVDLQLEVLDLLRVWIDEIRAHRSLPDDAVSVSHLLIARLSASNVTAGAAEADPSIPSAAVNVTVAGGWIDGLAESQRIAAFRAVVEDGLSVCALEYQPDKDCYFRGEDPLLTCRGMTDLLAFRIETVGPEPALDEFDPYACRLQFFALSTAPRAELEHLFRYVADQIRIVEIPADRFAVPAGTDEADAGAETFAGECAVWLADGHLPKVREGALALLAATDAKRRSASALRWLIAAIDCAAPQTQLLRLARAVGGNHASSEPSDSVPPSDLVKRIVGEQRRILALPADDAVVRMGRIASVGRTLANIAAAHHAAGAVRNLGAATDCALAANDQRFLFEAADECFEGGRRTAAATGSSDASAAADKPDPAAETRGQSRMLKVDQAKIDRLMALIGELVVAKNALPFLARRAENVHGSREMSREIGQRYSVIDRLAQEMQEAIMEVRLLPVSEVFARFPRLVRDVARKLDKQIELVLEGEETQADKNIIELLGDPLIHIVRNAADHGIESPEARLAKGKPAQGTIRLKALQEGDSVVIEVSDDGRGVDTDRVITKALERGLIDEDQAHRMTPAEAANLIFHPGLSTMDKVSDLSGRGVGMDVVQSSICGAGGTVAVSSGAGGGTTVRLTLPLSMAVLRVMTIETAGTLYGVPIDLIAETVRVDASQIRHIQQSEAFLLRDTVVPLVRLRRLLRLPATAQEREAVLVLRLKTGLVGMVVDRFDEHMDIILKPLEGILVGLKGFSGTALLGDGRVLMILNIKELV